MAAWESAPLVKSGAWESAPLVKLSPADVNGPSKDSFGSNVIAGIGRAFVRGGRAVKEAIDAPAQAMERTFGGERVSRALGMPTAQESAAQTKQALAEAEHLDKPLMQTAGGKVGDVIGTVAMFAPTAFIPGANTVTGSALVGGVGSALTTPGGLAERGIAGAFGAAGGAGGQVIGQRVSKFAANRAAARAAEAAAKAEQNAVRDGTLREAQKAGYVVPPATANPTVMNRVLESISGKAQTAQSASVKNQEVTNKLARQTLGLPETAPLTPQTLQGIRNEAGKVYSEVSGSGRVFSDPQYARDISQLGQTAAKISKDFPDLPISGKDDINKLVAALQRNEFDSGSALELVKNLRAESSANLSKLIAGNNPAAQALGKAQRAAADAVENQLMRHLVRVGRPDLADSFDAARTMIAKTYTVERALNPNTGNVVAGDLVRQIKKGKYVGDDLGTAARFAGAFKDATKEVTGSPGVSALDTFGGLALGVATGNPLAVAAPSIGRTLTRNALLSGPAQRALANPSYASNPLALKLLEQTGRYGIPIGAGSVYAAQ